MPGGSVSLDEVVVVGYELDPSIRRMSSSRDSLADANLGRRIAK